MSRPSRSLNSPKAAEWDAFGWKTFALVGDGWEGEAVHVHTSGIVIEYDTFGDPADPAILLIMGFGTQLLGWDAELCHLLAGRGRYVIRYDNRDCGLSTKYDDVPVDLMDLIGAVTSGDVDREQAMTPYTLRDMASDGIALLRPARHRPCARGGFLDGRHDRAEDGGRISRPGVVADFDDVHDRGAGVRPVHPGGPAGPVLPAARRPGGYVAAAERELAWASRRYGDPASCGS